MRIACWSVIPVLLASAPQEEEDDVLGKFIAGPQYKTPQHPRADFWNPTFPHLHPKLLESWKSKIAWDIVERDSFSPNLSDTNFEVTPMGPVALGHRVYSGSSAVIYTLRDNPRFLMKYQARCDSSSAIHYLITDHHFASEAAEMDHLGPTVEFLSPPVRLPPNRVAKLPLTITDAQWLNCFQRGGVVRYMILENPAGNILSQFRSRHNHGVVPADSAFKITRAIIVSLRNLHQANIVHGNIIADNVVITNRSVRFMNFALSFYDDQPDRQNERSWDRGVWLGDGLSPWQIDGRPWGKRDDIYRAFLLLARMLHGSVFEEKERELFDLEKSLYIEALYKWRKESIFKLPGKSLFTPAGVTIMKIPTSRVEHVNKNLDRINQILNSLDDINTEPPYGELIRILDSCIGFVTRK